MDQMLANFEEPEKVNWVSDISYSTAFAEIRLLDLTTFKRDFSNAHTPPR